MNEELDTLAFEARKKEEEPEKNYDFIIQVVFVATISLLAGILLRRCGIV
jgi:hypothetical protein